MHQRIFAYWDGEDTSVHRPLLDDWRRYFPEFRIIGDAEIEPIIACRFPQYEHLYRKIRIPSCRSDIARLVGLLEWGGLYVDCSCTLIDARGVLDLFQKLSEFEVILFNLAQSSRPRSPAQIVTLNSMIFSRPASGIMRLLVLTGFENLQRHYEREEYGFIPYHIGLLTGPDHIRESVVEITNNWAAVKPQFRQTIKLINEEDAPFKRHIHRAYSTGGRHWFDRQNSEPLFSR